MSFNKILIINTFGIGDVLFTTPLITNIKRADPQTEIHYLANSRSASFLEHNPDIERVIVYDRDDFKQAYGRSLFEYLVKGRELLRSIRKERYDLVLDLSLDRGMGFLTALAQIPRRIGFDYKGRGLLLTDKIPFKGYEGRHVVEHYFDLLKEIGVPVVDKALVLHIPETDVQWANQWFRQKALIFAKPLIAVFPGGGASWGKSAVLKRWPVEKYAKLVDKMIEKYNAHIILMGNQADHELCRVIAEKSRITVHVAAGEPTITQTAALLKHCTLVVCNDGGPLHVAVAAGVPTVSIFGPVDDQVYGPYPTGKHIVVKKNLACQPCYRRFRMADCSHINCLNLLDVDEVLTKMERML
jgi:lipopolysaccharide heptosyltransferase II